MAYYEKIGLLVLNENQTKFLVCEKYPKDETTLWIIPGGKIENSESDIKCLTREIKEELNCELDIKTLKYIKEYIDISAVSPDRDISIKLYQGKLIGVPMPSSEIRYIHWIGREDIENPKTSPIIKNKIIPDLVRSGILK